MKDLTPLRQEFPLFQKKPDLLYFDSAATTQKPASVIDAITDFYRFHNATVHRGLYGLAREATEAYQAVRRQVQAFLHADKTEEIIFTRGTTASLNLVARSFGKAFLKPGDAVLISEVEHHSNMVPWQMVCHELGARLLRIPVDEKGELRLETLPDLLEKKVKIVSLAHVSNVLGTMHPLERIIPLAHQAGAVVCIDGAQSAPHFPIDVQKWDIDFFAFSGHKVYGPTGIGVLYGKRSLLEQMPPLEGGGDMIEQVGWDTTTYQPLPLKFEAGTPMIAEVIGLGAAIDFINRVGMQTISAWEHALLMKATRLLSEIPGLRIVGEAASKGAILSFTIEGVHPLDLATFLDCRDIAIRTGHLCSQPTMHRFGITTAARLSFGVYNNLNEIDHFMHVLKDVLSLLR